MGSRQTSRRRLHRVAAGLLVGWGLLWIAVRDAADEPSRQAFDVVAPVAPTPVRTGSRSLLVYELHCTNFSADDLTIISLEVTDAETGRLIASFAGAALAARLQPVGRASAAGGSVAPGMSAAIFVECAVPGSSTPRALAHQLCCRRTSDGESFVIAGPHLGLDPTPPVVLGAPVRGGPWVAVHHPDWPRGHRRVFYAVAGRARLPGRFAIDWVKVDGEGRVASGRAGETQSFFGYGADVLAVADASVAAVRDGMAESARVAENPPHALDEAAGNFVSLALPGGRYAIYEHLRPGSIRVRTGDRVRRGDVIAQLGFTGDSTGPHLHLHVADSPRPLVGEGLPYVFEAFGSLGRYEDIGTLGSARWNPDSGETPPQGAEEFPDFNAVVEFAP